MGIGKMAKARMGVVAKLTSITARKSLVFTSLLAAVLIASYVVAGFPSATANVVTAALIFLGPAVAALLGLATGRSQGRRSILALLLLGLIPMVASVLSIVIGRWTGRDHSSAQALTNAAVALAVLTILEPLACVVVGLVAEAMGRAWRRGA